VKRKKIDAYLAPMPLVTTRKIRGPMGFVRRAKRTDEGIDVCENFGSDIARETGLHDHAKREAEQRASENRSLTVFDRMCNNHNSACVKSADCL
jgi:hypothetical protein